MEIISVTFAWKWGGAKVVTCSDTVTLEEIARDHGFADISETPPLYISRGRILDPLFTLRALRIAHGQKIIAYLPASARPRRPQQTRADLRAVRYWTLSDVEDEEASRQADQDFANWECSRAFPAVARDLLAVMEAEDARQTAEAEPEPAPTVLLPATQISEDPLPRLSDRERSWMTALNLGFTDLP
jgi:hypothetical protein